jgi:hypothetical protein
MKPVVALVTYSARDADGVSIETVRAIEISLGDDILSLFGDEIARDGETLVRVLSIVVHYKCRGCRYDHPGQLAHMDEGGCLEE